MKRDHILQRLKELEGELQGRGVLHAALFGSVARNEQSASSDIDSLVELDDAKIMTIFEYAGVKRFIAAQFDGPVDVVSRENLKADVGPPLPPRRSMHSETERTALLHIRDAITTVQSFVAGLTYDAFDRKTFFASTRALEIVSEASRRLSPALKERHPGIPGADVAGAGNIYHHDYEDVAERYGWSTIHDALPTLQNVVEAELSDEAS